MGDPLAPLEGPVCQVRRWGYRRSGRGSRCWPHGRSGAKARFDRASTLPASSGKSSPYPNRICCTGRCTWFGRLGLLLVPSIVRNSTPDRSRAGTSRSSITWVFRRTLRVLVRVFATADPSAQVNRMMGPGSHDPGRASGRRAGRTRAASARTGSAGAWYGHALQRWRRTGLPGDHAVAARTRIQVVVSNKSSRDSVWGKWKPTRRRTSFPCAAASGPRADAARSTHPWRRPEVDTRAEGTNETGASGDCANLSGMYPNALAASKKVSDSTFGVRRDHSMCYRLKADPRRVIRVAWSFNPVISAASPLSSPTRVAGVGESPHHLAVGIDQQHRRHRVTPNAWNTLFAPFRRCRSAARAACP